MSTTATITSIPQGTWTIDPSHSSVEFTVKHMGLATVRGQFTEFEGTIESDGERASVTGNVDASSVTTHNKQRDEHLATSDFFGVEDHPQISFKAESIELGEDGTVRIPGEITLKGVTKQIELTGDYAGAGTDPWGNERVGLDVSAKIDRRDFGLDWNQPLTGGGLLVSNGVTLLLSASAVKGA
ncbi:MAG TPA: YceI family protein [Thermoleophilaceae bacterium]|jgi:polyisoprenoid-binding protein YceI